jgi:hypothetical protein
MGFFPQDLGSERMERGNREPGEFFGNHGFHSVNHFTGGLVRERDRKDFGLAYALRNEVSDPIRDYSRLAGTGTGEDEHGAFDRMNCGQLFLIQQSGKVEILQIQSPWRIEYISKNSGT